MSLTVTLRSCLGAEGKVEEKAGGITSFMFCRQFEEGFRKVLRLCFILGQPQRFRANWGGDLRPDFSSSRNGRLSGVFEVVMNSFYLSSGEGPFDWLQGLAFALCRPFRGLYRTEAPEDIRLLWVWTVSSRT